MSFSRRMAFVCAATLATVLVAPARAEECPPLKMLASVDLVMSHDGRVPDVPVEIAGVPKLMRLDTGSDITAVSELAANELHLESHEGGVRNYNITGTYTDRYAAASLKIGNLKGKVSFMVDPNINELGPDNRVAGLLSSDILSHYDVSVDFGTGKFELLDQNHCDGRVIYWQASAVAVVPIKRHYTTAIIVTLDLEGKSVKAIVDTGAPYSTIRIDAAEKLFGIKPGDPTTPATGHGLNGRDDLKTYRHTFKSLSFEGVQVGSPELVLIPDMMSGKFGPVNSTGSLIAQKDEKIQPDILLGMNVLRHMHLYVAYKEKNLYVTPAGQPASPAK